MQQTNMIRLADRQFVECDGEGCEARALAPVALRAVLRPESAGSWTTTEGWLFVVKNDQTYHYCPRCAQKLVEKL